MQLNDGIIKAIRWVAVLPAAFAAYFVMSAVLVVIGKLFGEDIIAILGIAMFAPIAFAHAGSKTAPSHQNATAVGLAVLLITIILTTCGFLAAGIVKIHATKLTFTGAALSVFALVSYAIHIRKNEGGR